MTVEVNKSNPTNGILWVEILRESTIVTASAQTINFTWLVNVTDVLGVPTVEVLSSAWAMAFTDLTDVPANYTWSAWRFVQVNATEDGLQFIDLVSRLESLTDLDLSNVIITLGEIGGDITFSTLTTIDRTNTTNTGTQYFDENYIGNYEWSTINYTEVIFNSTLSTYNYDGDIFNIVNSTFNSTNNTYNHYWDIINYDEDTQFNVEWDIYIGGDIIVMNNESHNASTVIQTWLWTSYTDLNNVLLCDLAYAVATPIDPTDLDSIQLIVWWSIAWDDLWLGVTWGNPVVYGWSAETRGNSLTPAIVNATNFGCAFKFGDSKTIEVSDFGFTIPATDTILWVKVEVIFNSTSDTVSVDCIVMTVYHTSWQPVVTEPATDEFTGDGIEDTFTLSDTPIYTNIMVYLNGLRQKPADYSLSWDDVIFVTAPWDGDDILVDYLK